MANCCFTNSFFEGNDRIRRAMVLATMLGAAAVGSGCSGDGGAMLLDSICNNEVSFTNSNTPGCRTEGDALITTGISGDSTAIRFGPKGGSLHIRINAIPASGASSWSLDVLAASSRPEANTISRSVGWGSCGASCPADPADATAPLESDFQWIIVIDGELGSNFAVPPDDATLTLRGTSVDVLDLRTPGYEELGPQF